VYKLRLLEPASSQSASDVTPRVRKVTFVDEDDPFGVASSARPPIAKMSSNAWVSSYQHAKLTLGGMWWRQVHLGDAR
jgi:hypothetical protein